MAVIAVVLSGLGLFIYGFSALIAEKFDDTESVATHRGGSLGSSAAPSSIQMPTYTPSARRTTYSAPVSYTPTTVRHTSTVGSTVGGYRVHERQFNQSAYQGGNGGGSYGGGSTTSTGRVYATSAFHTGSVSFAMPAIAMSSSRIGQMTAMEESLAMGATRRAKPGYDGYNGQTVTDGAETWIWSEDEEDWVNSTPEGATKIEGGETYVYKGGAWVKISNQADPNAPIGSLPVLLLLLLCVGYAGFRRYRCAD